jgi:hypothetical protein
MASEAWNAAKEDVLAEMRDLPVTDPVKQWLLLKAAFENEFPGERGNKSKTLENGMTIERRFRKQLSNSRKSSTWLMDITVRNADGTVLHHYPDPSGPNRANDPDRNWGLGRD